MSKKKPDAEHTMTLNVRERQFLRGVLMDAVRLYSKLAQDARRVHYCKELQQSAFMADRLLGKLEEPLDGFVGEWKVALTRLGQL